MEMPKSSPPFSDSEYDNFLSDAVRSVEAMQDHEVYDAQLQARIDAVLRKVGYQSLDNEAYFAAEYERLRAEVEAFFRQQSPHVDDSIIDDEAQYALQIRAEQELLCIEIMKTSLLLLETLEKSEPLSHEQLTNRKIIVLATLAVSLEGDINPTLLEFINEVYPGEKLDLQSQYMADAYAAARAGQEQHRSEVMVTAADIYAAIGLEWTDEEPRTQRFSKIMTSILAAEAEVGTAATITAREARTLHAMRQVGVDEMTTRHLLQYINTTYPLDQ